jgi:hypothetical protein
MTTGYGITKTENQVFGKWLTWQKVFDDCSLAWAGNLSSPDFFQRIAAYDTKQTRWLVPMRPLLDTIFVRDAHGVIIGVTDQFDAIRNEMAHDSGRFLKRLASSDWCSPVRNIQEEEQVLQDTIKQYNTFFRLLFLQKNDDATHKIMFTVANVLFETCYAKQFKRFSGYLNNPAQHQMARLAQSVIWQQLVGHGWRNWHGACLKQLVQAAKNAKEIVYVAGGNDMREILHALLRAKTRLFTIRSIDPMLQTQEDFYADGYTWLLDGGENDHGIGDSVTLTIDGREYHLVRTDYHEDGVFTAKLATGVEQKLPLSTTTWQVRDQDGVVRGRVIFERRFCQQADFEHPKNRTVLLSFNEMYHVALPQDAGGWGISLDALPKDLRVLVKQLRKPVTLQVLKNLHQAEKAPCYFMFLGSCSN